MKKFIFLCALLVGCATNQPLEQIKIPIYKPCEIETPAEPTYAFDQLTKEDSIWTKVKALLSDRQLYIAYTKELQAVLDACK